jgi:hypothetical protein
VAGSHQTEPFVKTTALREHTVGGRRSGPGEAVLLDGRRWKRSWSPARGSDFRVLAGYEMERQRRLSPTLRAVDKAVAREHRPERCSALLGNELRAVSGGAEARCAPSSAHRSGAALPQGSSAPAPRKSAEVHPSRVARSGARGRSVMAKASCPEIGQSTGARVVCRLQKSVRSIFLSLDSRQAARRTATTRGSAARQFIPLTRGACHVERKGAGRCAQTDTRTRNRLTRPQGRASIRWKAS